MIVISQPHLNHSRVYFGTDTRLQTLLLGVILAFLWPPFKLKAEPPKVLQRAIDGVGFIGLAFLILLFLQFKMKATGYMMAVFILFLL